MSSFTFTAPLTGSQSAVVPFPVLDLAHIKGWRRTPTNQLFPLTITPSRFGSTVSASFTATAGDLVVLYRDTPDVPLVQFSGSGPVRAEDLNLAINQTLYLAEEAKSAGLVVGSAPAPTAAGQVLLSIPTGGGTFGWQLSSINDLKDALGVPASSQLPAVSGANLFLLTNASGTGYILSNAAAAKTLLSIRELPAPVASRFLHVDATNVYVLSDAAATRTALGLSPAATLTVGTAANNLVQLDGSARLPAVDGSLLTNIGSSNTWTLTENGTPTAVSGSTVHSLSTGYGAAVPSPAPPWISLWTNASGAGDNGVVLNAGTYLVRVRYRAVTWTNGTVNILPRLNSAEVNFANSPWSITTVSSSGNLGAVADGDAVYLVNVQTNNTRLSFRSNSTGTNTSRLRTITVARLT